MSDKWICFFCGFSTSDKAEAAAHFGDRNDFERLREALDTFGRHLSGCAGDSEICGKCDCGLDAALNTPQASPK